MICANYFFLSRLAKTFPIKFLYCFHSFQEKEFRPRYRKSCFVIIDFVVYFTYNKRKKVQMIKTSLAQTVDVTMDPGAEDNVPGEGLIYYDIRFTAYHKEKELKILINIEAQKSSDSSKLGYHLENRIIFYLARMISAQKQTEFFHSDFDNLKKVRSIWICMDNDAAEDSIEEIGFDRKTVFGNKKNSYHADLMKGIIVNISSEDNNSSGEAIKKSKNVLIAMLEELLFEKDAAEKKRILAEEYGMIMTVELERRIQIMCNWSEVVGARAFKNGFESGFEDGVEDGILKERIAAIGRMIRANATKEQIISYGYTEAEYAKAESDMYVNS